MKKSSGIMKMGPVMSEDDIKPRLELYGKHAKAFAKHKIGSKVKMTVIGKKTSHSVNSGGGHNVCIECHKVMEHGTENVSE